jgi:hypothetical protein
MKLKYLKKILNYKKKFFFSFKNLKKNKIYLSFSVPIEFLEYNESLIKIIEMLKFLVSLQMIKEDYFYVLNYNMEYEIQTRKIVDCIWHKY